MADAQEGDRRPDNSSMASIGITTGMPSVGGLPGGLLPLTRVKGAFAFEAKAFYRASDAWMGQAWNRPASANFDPPLSPLDRVVAALTKVWIALEHWIPGLSALTNFVSRTVGAWRLPRDGKLRNLGELSGTLYRGAQPSAAAFATLKRMGFDTVINLRVEDNSEASLVRQLGMKPIYLPEDNLGAPTMADTLKFLADVTDPANGKVFFHCYHGSDRTGTMAAAYRIAADGYSLDRAMAELPKYGFHWRSQEAKVQFLEQFSHDWKALPEATRAMVLHRPLPLPARLHL